MSDKLSARSIYAFGAAVFATFIVCGFFIFQTAGGIADNVHRRDTQQLVYNEFQHQLEFLARDQSQISNWSDTLRALGKTVNTGFFREEVADWLWTDFGIRQTVVISPDGKPRVTVIETRLVQPEMGNGLKERNADLVAEARRLYFKLRKPKGAGFAFPLDPFDHGAYSADLRVIDGQIGAVVAQAIVPNDGFVLPVGNPNVLFTFKPIKDDVFARMAEKLGLVSLQVHTSRPAASDDLAAVRVGKSGLWATWQLNNPSRTISQEALPAAVVVLLVIGIALTMLCVRYARALAALKRSEDENRFMALHDALTGLPNRLHFDKSLSESVARDGAGKCAVLCIDLDRFKAVNDTWGHEAGDTVLKAVANRIAACVGDAGMAARLGGDEFIVLLRDGLDHDNVMGICNDIIASVSRDIAIDGGTANVGASIGIARWPENATTAQSIIRSADKALYRAKQTGRGQACMAEEQPGEDAAKPPQPQIAA